MRQSATLILLAQLISPCLAALSITLAPTEEFCFTFRTPKDEPAHVTGSYDMVNDDQPAEPLTAILFDYETDKVAWHSEYGKSEDSFALNLSGKFHYCFGNGAGGYKTEEEKNDPNYGNFPEGKEFDYTNKDGNLRTIGFTLRVKPLEGTEAADMMQVNTDTGNAADEQKRKLEQLGHTLLDKMEILGDHQEYIKNREASHRHIVEQTFTLVMRWTLLEAFVLFTVAFLQVTFLKRFFETKRYL